MQADQKQLNDKKRLSPLDLEKFRSYVKGEKKEETVAVDVLITSMSVD